MTKKMYPTGEIRYFVGYRHVSESDYSVFRWIAKWSKDWNAREVTTPGGATISGRRARLSACRYAVGCHRVNWMLYRDVVTGKRR